MIELELIINQKDYELSVKDAALAVKNKEIEEKNNTIKQLTEKLQLFQSQYHDTIMELRDKLRVKDDKIEELSTKLAEVVAGNKKHDDEVEYWKNSIDLKNDYIDELHEQIEDLESIIEGQKDNIADLENRIEDLKIGENGLSNQFYWYKLANGATSCKLVAEGVTVVRSEGVTVVRTDYFEQLKEELEKHKQSTKENCQLRLEIEKLKDRLSSTSDKDVTKGPDKMPDYEGFRKIADEVQRKMIEEQKKRLADRPVFGYSDVDTVNNDTKGLWVSFYNE